MREIKFRQARCGAKGNFVDWFYWGFLDDGSGLHFVAPLQHNVDNYQFTGYKYKDLRDAYEGDIFDAFPDGTRRFLRTIIWNDELAGFQAPFSDGSGIQLFTKRECLLYEYVGNIHQPKLMEKKQ